MRDRINAALKAAMKDQDRIRVATLRLICAALKEHDIAARGDDAPAEMKKEEVLSILSKMVKQREESARVYAEGGREDLAARERSEIKIIREFMPKPLSEEDAAKAVAAAIRETEAQSIKDMGKVMGALKEKYRGRMDFTAACDAVRSALA